LETKTLDDLKAEQGQLIARMADIIDTAKQAQRSLTVEERAEYDDADAKIGEVQRAITEAAETAGDAARAARLDAVRSFHVPNVNRIDREDSLRASGRNLDEILWATNEDVAAGSFDRTGAFRSFSNARNSVEQVVVRNDDGEGVLAPRIDDFLPHHHRSIRSFQQLVADMSMFGLLIDRSARTGAEGFQAARSHRAFKDRWQHALRAMDTDTSAEGTEWIPTGIGASLHERVRASGKVAALFPRINLPTNPWKWPLEGADATAYRVAEPTSDTATKVTVSTPGTGAATFDAEIFGGRVLFSKSLEADSALAILPFVQTKLIRAFVDAEEKAILDGDTDGTHQDSDVGSSTTDARTAWDGLRKRGLANSAASAGSALTVALLAARRADMDQYGINPMDMAFIIPMSSYYALLSDTNVLTVDKFGPQATILNGQLASVYGVPIIVSEHIRSDLNASGVYDGITTTKTAAYAVSRTEWVMGQRSPLALEVDDSIYRETYQRVVVGFMREDFANVNARGSSEDDTGLIYNVTP